ncbi:unsaturated rhamnogalacturonyl hydrolase [Geodermatophilus amargosae]|uniref:Unsaturated rhamnogalacturonyl hydrolase n=1 Tax=Geodermatophilus amargosae TaxID=1296565 RepID=A0A1I7CRG0_9ACTN|nr:glycoside hydrolase family 88 protein [Geodermatophilus amargosae]SFU01929.1 unsaturated rhamnogalacturonyl hydrolase [Geodermatophilus amargosae]
MECPPAGPVLDDGTRRRVLGALLVCQRHSWDQGLTAAVLDGDGEDSALRALVGDAVARQLPDGRLAELDPACSVNGGIVGEYVDLVARRTGDAALTAAAARQRAWLLRSAPRAADGTLFHLVGPREVWADTVCTVVPPLAAAGHGDAALAQLDGHRSRLRRPDGLWRARWDEDAGRPADDRAWGTGNGWVAAGLARTVGRLPAASGAALAAELRALLDGCLAHRRPDGTLGDVLDDDASRADPAAAATLSYAALTGAGEGWLPAPYGAVGRALLVPAVASLDGLGRVSGAPAAPRFDRPGHSPEAQALLLLADAAARPLPGDGLTPDRRPRPRSPRRG